jgi:transaldolase
MPIMLASKALLAGQPKAELLWASVREVLNIFQSDQCGCDIVTVPHDILGKAIKLVRQCDQDGFVMTGRVNE